MGWSSLAPEVRLTAVSPLYESAPWGVTDQPAFLNAALLAETDLSPHALLDKLKAVEAEVGRRPGKRWGPRVVDLDILLYDDLQLDDDRLTIPHPRSPSAASCSAPSPTSTRIGCPPVGITASNEFSVTSAMRASAAWPGRDWPHPPS